MTFTEQMLASPELLAGMHMTLKSDAEGDHLEQAARHLGRWILDSLMVPLQRSQRDQRRDQGECPTDEDHAAHAHASCRHHFINQSH